MNTSAGLLFIGIGLALLWLAITGRLQAMLDAITGATYAPVPAAVNVPGATSVVDSSYSPVLAGPTVAPYGPQLPTLDTRGSN